ncbi:hypothetical protein AU210_015867 [Fusarium oxysporum f. sp. radicis-cucumerinum]|uniref:PI3K/PI4K catalytic domain-containing protein n=1 Tax=Fusarium oxysporum f. sp. radicis-cucumerinum TaxID=327505 RepID=A0A2H3FRR3_FUSOX|nr:hypothetical protein AU210_015867 [Fusarium oxysporum f. sp. radicis-cucumerinum]
MVFRLRESSEAWLERRTNYTCSLGVIFMVGYILGLDDQHRSNLMLDRVTGKPIHIDFGNYFEVTMKCEKYPERVPFRLTRMLTYAMEASNIDGSFRITCENVMRILRDNKERVTAVLEARRGIPGFSNITWRLTNAASPTGPNFRSDREIALADPGGTCARRLRSSSAQDGNTMVNGAQQHQELESQNARGAEVLDRVAQKLMGRVFKNS